MEEEEEKLAKQKEEQNEKLNGKQKQKSLEIKSLLTKKQEVCNKAEEKRVEASRTIEVLAF